MRLALALAIGLAADPAFGQGADPARAQTLADIRQQILVLQSDIDGLRRELSTTQGPAGAGGGTLLDRVGAIEAELVRLTGLTEQLQIRIERIVADGTNRIGDLDFRLTELAGGDIMALGPTPPLGGEAAVAPPGALPPVAGGAEVPQFALAERADFDRARAAYDAGDFAGAAELFGAFAATYTGGPLTVEAQFLRGQALEATGQTAPAARAYLDAFTAAPDGPRAPESLYRLGLSLAGLGQVAEGCMMLQQMAIRYPDSALTVQAGESMRSLGCN